jgi:hypothetical protein
VNTPDSRKRRAKGGSRDKRAYSFVHSLRCTKCEAILLTLWNGLNATTERERWHASDPTPCAHVTAEEIDRYRFTKARHRDELALPIRTARRRRGTRRVLARQPAGPSPAAFDLAEARAHAIAAERERQSANADRPRDARHARHVAPVSAELLQRMAEDRPLGQPRSSTG